MEFTRFHIGMATFNFGLLAFIFGVIAENKKPANGNPFQIDVNTIRCNYPHDPSIALGSLSIICLAISSAFGVTSVFFSYKGKTIPTHALWRSTALVTFFTISTLVSVLASSFLIWAIITESLHRYRKTHHNLNTNCPTAKTGLFGGAAFLALDASLFWLICQMLTMNAREDYEEDVEDTKGDYEKVTETSYISHADVSVNGKV